MKKMLIIAIGLMFSCLSAKTLPDHYPMINYEKITIQEPLAVFAAQILYVENATVLDLFVQPTESVQCQTFNYVSDVSFIDLAFIYQPILYERSDKINPLVNYDIYNARDVLNEHFNKINPVSNYNIYRPKDKFKNEIVVDNEFRIQTVPKDFELV